MSVIEKGYYVGYVYRDTGNKDVFMILEVLGYTKTGRIKCQEYRGINSKKPEKPFNRVLTPLGRIRVKNDWSIYHTYNFNFNKAIYLKTLDRDEYEEKVNVDGELIMI